MLGGGGMEAMMQNPAVRNMFVASFSLLNPPSNISPSTPGPSACRVEVRLLR